MCLFRVLLSCVCYVFSLFLVGVCVGILVVSVFCGKFDCLWVEGLIGSSGDRFCGFGELWICMRW